MARGLGVDIGFAKPTRTASPSRGLSSNSVTSITNETNENNFDVPDMTTSSTSSSSSEGSHSLDLTRQSSQTSDPGSVPSATLEVDSGYGSSKENERSPTKFSRLRKRSKSRNRDKDGERSRATTPEPTKTKDKEERTRGRAVSFKKINNAFRSKSKERAPASTPTSEAVHIEPIPPMPQLPLPIALKFMRQNSPFEDASSSTSSAAAPVPIIVSEATTPRTKAKLTAELWNHDTLLPSSSGERPKLRQAHTAPNSPMKRQASFDSVSTASPITPLDRDPLDLAIAAHKFPYGPPPTPGDEPQPKSFLSMSSSTVNLIEVKGSKKGAKTRFLIPVIRRDTGKGSVGPESVSGQSSSAGGGSSRLAALATAIGNTTSIGVMVNQAPASQMKGQQQPKEENHFSYVEVDEQEVALTPMSWIEVPDNSLYVATPVPDSAFIVPSPTTPSPQTPTTGRSETRSFIATDSIYGSILYAQSIKESEWRRGKQAPFPQRPVGASKNSAPRIRIISPPGGVARYRDCRVFRPAPEARIPQIQIVEPRGAGLPRIVEPPFSKSIPTIEVPDDVSSLYPEDPRLTIYSIKAPDGRGSFMDESGSRFARDQFEEAVRLMVQDDSRLRV